jgi:hypothetical protein
MPPLPSPGKVIKLQVKGSNEGGEFMNIFHISYNGANPTTATLNNVDAAIRPSLEHVYGHNGVDTIVSLPWTYTDLSSDTGAVYIVNTAITGTLTGDVVSINNAVCVSWPILRRYRGGHPRNYFALGSSSTLDGSSTINWQDSFIANVQDDLHTFQTTVAASTTTGAGTLALVNVSYYSGGALRTTPLVDTLGIPVAKKRVCSQRRRLGKVGG